MAWVSGGKHFGQYIYEHWFDEAYAHAMEIVLRQEEASDYRLVEELTRHGIKGIFEEGELYDINENELEEFERGFTKKEKALTKTQARFMAIAKTYL
ncbi:MAG: hypothetical protein LBC51_01825 [Treponema sp.]|jgi:hypothetical protein|nr:hypothetical protein [Treponema sp.]